MKATPMNARSSAVEVHPLDPSDAPVTAAIRAMSSAGKGASPGPDARAQYDSLIGSVAPLNGVTFETDTVGGVQGVWAVPEASQASEAILHLHGGWFNFGTAEAYRNLVGQIAGRANARAFIPNYRLAPEHPFPAAADDALACFKGLWGKGVVRVAISGDSAGGNLALGLAPRVVSGEASTNMILVGIAVMSPVTDLTLSSETYSTRAEADFFFTRSQVAELVGTYLGKADPVNPLASPLRGQLAGMPPVRIHVGDDEILLDDSRRFVDRAVGAGVDAKVDVWMGMPHGFVVSVGKLKAASRSLDAIGAFLAEKLHASS